MLWASLSSANRHPASSALVLLQIERAVGENVGFHSLVDADASAEARVDLVDLMLLTDGSLHSHAARDWQAVGVIRDADPRPSELVRGLREIADWFDAV